MARETDKRWKGILIDWDEISDMDAEDYELKPLNQQQTAILLALLEYQKWPTRWVNLGLSKTELETYIADIEQRLMRNEGENMATVEEICEGVMCALKEAAGSFLAGAVAGASGSVTIDEDGNVSVTPSTGFEDDPTTTADNEARSGGAQSVYQGFRQLILDLNSWITQGLSDTAITFRMGSKYLTNADMAAGITLYKTQFLTPPPSWTTPVITSGLASYIYCKGNTRQVMNRYIIDTWDAEIEALLAISNGLEQSQLTVWFEFGETVPSLDYLDYNCVPVAFITPKTYVMGNNNVPMTPNAKINHRHRMTISGKITDTAHPTRYRDFFYNVDTNTGVKTYVTDTNQCNVGGASGVVKPTQNEVPWNASGVYIFTIDSTAAGAIALSCADAFGGSAWLTAPLIGNFTVELIDEGEYLP